MAAAPQPQVDVVQNNKTCLKQWLRRQDAIAKRARAIMFAIKFIRLNKREKKTGGQSGAEGITENMQKIRRYINKTKR